jgi:hypothetical protein
MSKRIIAPSPRPVDATLLPAELPETKALATQIFSTSTYSLNLPDDLSLEQYVGLAPRFGLMAKCMLWWAGDYLVYGERKFGEKHRDAMDNLTGILAGYYSRGSLTSASWVSRNITPKERRPELTWNHHLLVAKIKDRHERKHWLDRAVSEKLSTRDMAQEMAEDRKAKRARTANSQPLNMHHFPDEKLLKRVQETTTAFSEALDSAMALWQRKGMFDHHAIRPCAEDLCETVELFLARLVPEQHGRILTARRLHAVG